jgi:hypothetical protein
MVTKTTDRLRFVSAARGHRSRESEPIRFRARFRREIRGGFLPRILPVPLLLLWEWRETSFPW